jgi:hypothetical protein
MSKLAVLAFLAITLVATAPALAQRKDCSKLNDNDQAACYYEQAEEIAGEILDVAIEKCEEAEKKEPERAQCTALAMAFLLAEVKKSGLRR